MDKRQTEFDWLVRLEELAKSGDYSWPHDYHELTSKAQGWPTCACGQLCKLLPRNPSNSPQDRVLHDLGCKFFKCICSRQWNEALKIFRNIEARTTILLIEMGIVKQYEATEKSVNRGNVPYCVEPGNVLVFKTSSNTFATTASGSTASKATHRLHSEHGIPKGN